MKRDTPYKYCEATFFVPIHGEEFSGVQFFIYKSDKDLQAGVQDRGGNKSTVGYFCANCLGGDHIRGEIHLSNEWMGAGYVAHEIQHFIAYWILSNHLDIDDADNEKICTVASELTRLFWSKFYDLFEKKEDEK